MHSRRWTQVSPILRQSSQPLACGVASRSWSRWGQVVEVGAGGRGGGRWSRSCSLTVRQGVRSFQGSTIPPGQGGADLVGAPEEVQNQLVGGGGPPDLLVRQDELAQVEVVVGRVRPDRRVPAAGRLGIG